MFIGLSVKENRFSQKIIFQVIAEEVGTSNKSSTATITVSITDTNDNRPVFDEESYSISVLGTKSLKHPDQQFNDSIFL